MATPTLVVVYGYEPELAEILEFIDRPDGREPENLPLPAAILMPCSRSTTRSCSRRATSLRTSLASI
jgi:hypothetical protein